MIEKYSHKIWELQSSKIAYILHYKVCKLIFIEVGGVSVNGKREHRRTKTEDTTVDDPF